MAPVVDCHTARQSWQPAAHFVLDSPFHCSCFSSFSPSLLSEDPRLPSPLFPRSVSAENSPCGNPTLGTQDPGFVCLHRRLSPQPPRRTRSQIIFSSASLSMDAFCPPNVSRRTAFSYNTSFSASFHSHCHSSYYHRAFNVMAPIGQMNPLNPVSIASRTS